MRPNKIRCGEPVVCLPFPDKFVIEKAKKRLRGIVTMWKRLFAGFFLLAANSIVPGAQASAQSSSTVDVPGPIIQRPGPTAGTPGYLQVNGNNSSDRNLLNGGMLIYGSEPFFWGTDLGYNTSVSRYRTRIFAHPVGDIAFSFTSSPTAQSSFNDSMVIRGDSGNVGIGTPNPSQKLEVNGNIALTLGSNGVIVFADGTTQSTAAGSTSTPGSVTPGPPNSAITNVNGILHVTGNVYPSLATQGGYLGWNALTGGTGETDFLNNQGGGPGGFAFFNTPPSGSPASVLMFLTGAGRLGIGTTNPSQALEVGGGVKISGPLVFGDGTVQTSAAQINATTNNDIISFRNAAGTAGIQLSDNAQAIGGIYGPGGSLDIMANSPTNADTGGHIQLGGSQRGDGLRSKIVLSGNSPQPLSGILVNGANNVGMGLDPSADPASGARLEVNGTIVITRNSAAGIIFQDGTAQSTAWNGKAPGGDYAESVEVDGEADEYGPGDLMMIDAAHPGSFLKANTAYSKLVAGVYSTKPGFTGRRLPQEKSDAGEVPMAMIGIVPTKVCNENGPIVPGDLLVAASLPGYAMKGIDSARLLGSVIGKALDRLEGDKAVIEVLITLQ